MASHAPKASSPMKNVLRATTGNFLEMFDFMVYGFYASIIADVLFPSGDPAFSLLMSWITFGIGFLMRPLGAIVLGAYSDKHGRRAGLLLSLALMSVGIVIIALVPSYATIGIFAPIIVILGRLLQGFSAGAESGTVSVYLAEIAPENRRGLFASLQTCSQQIAVIFAAVIGVVLRLSLTTEQMAAWGWRIPFLIGSLLIPFLLVVRRSMQESQDFAARKTHPTTREIFATIGANWKLIGNAVLMITLTAVMFYLITSYISTFGTKVLKLAPMDSFIVTICLGCANLVWMPTVASLSDRIGRAPVLLTCSAGIAIFSYPTMVWLVSDPSFGRLLATVLFLGSLYGCWQGTLIISLVEMMPANVRSTGWSLAYSLTYALLGGFTPAMVTWLIQVTGNKAMPGVALTGAAIIGFIGTVMARNKFGKGTRNEAAHAPQGARLGSAL